MTFRHLKAATVEYYEWIPSFTVASGTSPASTEGLSKPEPRLANPPTRCSSLCFFDRISEKVNYERAAQSVKHVPVLPHQPDHHQSSTSFQYR